MKKEKQRNRLAYFEMGNALILLLWTKFWRLEFLKTTIRNESNIIELYIIDINDYDETSIYKIWEIDVIARIAFFSLHYALSILYNRMHAHIQTQI